MFIGMPHQLIGQIYVSAIKEVLPPLIKKFHARSNEPESDESSKGDSNKDKLSPKERRELNGLRIQSRRYEMRKANIIEDYEDAIAASFWLISQPELKNKITKDGMKKILDDNNFRLPHRVQDSIWKMLPAEFKKGRGKNKIF